MNCSTLIESPNERYVMGVFIRGLYINPYWTISILQNIHILRIIYLPGEIKIIHHVWTNIKMNIPSHQRQHFTQIDKRWLNKTTKTSHQHDFYPRSDYGQVHETNRNAIYHRWFLQSCTQKSEPEVNIKWGRLYCCYCGPTLSIHFASLHFTCRGLYVSAYYYTINSSLCLSP